VPVVTIQLFLKPDDTEHYDTNEILLNADGSFLGGILYKFFIKNPEELLQRVKSILKATEEKEDVQLSLLPIELYEYSITVPEKGSKVSYDTLSKFRVAGLPINRDGFALDSDRIGSKALSNLLNNQLEVESVVKIEKAYKEFFNIIRSEGKLDEVLNWQEYSEIKNAHDFFKEVSVLPNMPPMSSILNSVSLGYGEESMFMQGLGNRNLILMAVLLNSYMNKSHDISFRLLTVEEPEAHLCINNILLMAQLFSIFSQKNSYTQIMYSTHSTEFVNKLGLDKIIVLHDGATFALSTELTPVECDYLAANPNTDIFKMLYSRKLILVEGLTEELLIKSYLQTKKELNDIKVLSFHKGFLKIIGIWKKINRNTTNKLGVVRDFDNEPNAKEHHEKEQNENVIVRTTEEYTLETDITSSNYQLLRQKYGEVYGWTNLSLEDLQSDWRKRKSDVMLRICHDLVEGELDGFVMPPHIREIIDFMQKESDEG
jgi:putative ATP-dependent endonuclease of the OLD family